MFAYTYNNMANGHQPLVMVKSIDQVIAHWPWASAKAAREVVKKYGMPHEATNSCLIWHYNNPWRRTIVWRDGVYHNFPRSHLDVLEQTLSYHVPADKISLLSSYNGSIMVNRTRGEITFCCANEQMNFLAANLSYQICIGQLTDDQARERHAEMIQALRLNWPEPDTEGLQFEVIPAAYGTEESDESRMMVEGPFRKHQH